MEKLINKYFDSPEAFSKGMLLLKKFSDLPDNNYRQYEYFLENLDERDDFLLDQALAMRTEHNEKINTKDEHIALLKQIAAHHSQNSNHKATYTADEDPKLSVLISNWLNTKKASGIKAATHDALEQRIDIFLKIITEIDGDEPTISQTSLTTIRKYNEVLKAIPAHRNGKKLVGKSFVQLSKLGLPTISSKTHEEYTNVVVDFFNWIKNNGYPIEGKLAGILLSSKVRRKLDSIKVIPFDNVDLSNIFNSLKYCSGSIKLASDYWVPLIALFTGARLAEICQLDVADIYLEDKDWLIDINDEAIGDEYKSIKNNKGSKRLVPIHKKLIELGLIEYRDKISKSSQTRLFPNEQRNKDNKFDAFSKRFSKQIERVGVKQTEKNYQRKSFHSFRHTVRTKLKEASPIEEPIIDMIVGHESLNRSTGETVYTHTQLVSHKAILLKNFPIRLSLIR